MSKLEKPKLTPRNAPAMRKVAEKNPEPHLVAGNPISTRLESGIGNCFPGLECDLRNLERRFFPFLEMDMPGSEISLVSVDIEGAIAASKAGAINQATLNGYLTLHAAGKWVVETMTGTFGPLGRQTLTIADLNIPSTGARRQPTDPWTAVRLLTEGTDVRLVLHRKYEPKAKKVTITAKRARYLGDDGALAAMFLPGELTQSLCSPWTHDFRDCGCYYWASNHPDIALPPLPTKTTSDPRWHLAVPWERRERTPGKLTSSATVNDPTPVEMRYFEINHRWQSLNFVLERRERLDAYAQRDFNGKPLDSKSKLEAQLRYAAGVELAVTQEYLAAAYSLKSERDLTRPILDDVRAAHAEIKRIAISEMRHLRAVNDVLASLLGRPKYKPALHVASKIPGVKSGHYVDVQPLPLTKEALENFIKIEAPSESVDGVYASILATLNQGYPENDVQAIRTVMAEGEDHYRTFLDIREWLKPYLDDERKYLRAGPLTRPPPGNEAHKTLQARYLTLLDKLYTGYELGMPGGAASLNAARDAMIEDNDSIVAAAEAVAETGYLVVFDPPTDPRFTAIPPP